MYSRYQHLRIRLTLKTQYITLRAKALRLSTY